VKARGDSFNRANPILTLRFSGRILQFSSKGCSVPAALTKPSAVFLQRTYCAACRLWRLIVHLSTGWANP